MTTGRGRTMVVARLAKEGRQVTYVILTNGDKGSGDRNVTSEPGKSHRDFRSLRS